jgi:nucleoid-associated protein YgaU
MTDASRLRVVGGVAVLAGVVVAGAYYGTGDRAAAPPVAVSASQPAAPAETARREAAAPPAPSATAPAARHASRPGQAFGPPRFDVVRMGARGNMVVAGRAAPGAEVVLYDGEREIGRARADSRGEWVILPPEPIGAGARELSLRSRPPGGEEIAGFDTVLVVGPSEPQAVAQARAEQFSLAEGASRAGQHARAQQPETAFPAKAASPTERTDQLARLGEASGSANGGDTAGEDSLPTAGPAALARPEQALILLLPPTATAAPRSLSARPAGEVQAPLGLDLVDYDDSNTMRFAGTAPAGAQLRVYAGDRHLGDAEADPAGRWSLSPAEPPPVGRHTLRVDQLNIQRPAGVQAVRNAAVTSRIEVAFQRESLPLDTVRGGRVVVQPGNSLWRLAREAYGRGIRYTVIYQANQALIQSPDRIFPGQIFTLPQDD